MRRLLALAAVLSVALGALYFAQRPTRHDAVSTNALVDVAADWQRDVTRVPMRLTRISDAEETQIGDQLANQYAEKYASSGPARTAEDRALEQYLDEVGGRVAAHAKRALFWHFHLLRDRNLVNAFALPEAPVSSRSAWPLERARAASARYSCSLM